eukprot:scaffold1146_cov399-Prasinococcus_capsulatus_cf.AAC.14
MGVTISRAETSTPPPPEAPASAASPPTSSGLPPVEDDELPCPVKYEEMQREAMCTSLSLSLSIASPVLPEQWALTCSCCSLCRSFAEA